MININLLIKTTNEFNVTILDLNSLDKEKWMYFFDKLTFNFERERNSQLKDKNFQGH